MNIDIIEPEIFNKDLIISGVTKKNPQFAGGKGLSFSPAETLTEEEVIEHQKILADFLNINHSNIKFQHQVHGIVVQEINIDSTLKDSDGMVTNRKGLALCVKIADCAAVLVYDPVNGAIGAFHSGWRGTQKNISKIGIQKMAELYKSMPDDLIVYISPCASGKTYEVGYDVARYFPGSVKQISDEKYLFDNRKEIFKQLTDLGVNHDNIEISDECTITNASLHSYRRDKENSGRMAAYICMKQSK